MGDEVSDTSDYVKRRMAPQDGGRGIELRRRWSCIRWFSWRYGSAWWRTHRTHLSFSWHAFYVDEVLVGVATYKDEDGDRHVMLGLGPLLRLAVWWTPWARPGALGWRYGAVEDQSVMFRKIIEYAQDPGSGKSNLGIASEHNAHCRQADA